MKNQPTLGDKNKENNMLYHSPENLRHLVFSPEQSLHWYQLPTPNLDKIAGTIPPYQHSNTRFLFLDIDYTIFITHEKSIKFTGAGEFQWLKFLTDVKKLDAQNGTTTHIGLLTFKSRTDILTDYLLSPRNIFYKFLNKNLLFLKNHSCKAMQLNRIQNALSQEGFLPSKYITIIDDNYSRVIEPCARQSFNAVYLNKECYDGDFATKRLNLRNVFKTTLNLFSYLKPEPSLFNGAVLLFDFSRKTFKVEEQKNKEALKLPYHYHYHYHYH